VPINLAELGRFGDQGAGDDIAEAEHALEQILFATSDRASFDQLVDGLVVLPGLVEVNFFARR
jgi:hypothetical protein